MLCRNFTLKMFDPKSKIIAFESSGYEAVIEHTHDFIEIVYITDGKGVHHINGYEINVGKGDMFIITNNDSHSMIPISPIEDLKWVNCIIDKKFMGADLIPTEPERTAKFGGKMDITFLVNMLLAEFRLKNINYQQVMKGLAITIFNKYQRALELDCVADESAETEPEFRRETYIQGAVDYINKNHTKKLLLDDIAKKVGISTGYLERLFREEKDTSPIEYLNLYRVEQACKLLIVSDMSIAEISEEVGFNDIKFFYVIFKRQTGITPRMYRMKKKMEKATKL